CLFFFFFFSSRRRHTRSKRDWSSDVALPICFSSSALFWRSAPTCFIFSQSISLSSISSVFPASLKYKSKFLEKTESIIVSATARSEERRVGQEGRSRAEEIQ